MKLEGTRLSNDGTDTKIFLFAMNAKEADMLRGLASLAWARLPKAFEASVLRSRLRTIIKGLSSGLESEGFTGKEPFEKEKYE